MRFFLWTMSWFFSKIEKFMFTWALNVDKRSDFLLTFSWNNLILMVQIFWENYVGKLLWELPRICFNWFLKEFFDANNFSTKPLQRSSIIENFIVSRAHSTLGNKRLSECRIYKKIMKVVTRCNCLERIFKSRCLDQGFGL